MNIEDLKVFITLSETLSLTKVADRLDKSPMHISRSLARLESQLSSRLVHRTTRSVSLTQEGLSFLPYAHSIVNLASNAQKDLHQSSKKALGLLKVSAPPAFSRRNILPILPALLAENPDLEMDLQMKDEMVDIVDEGIDVAIRIAPLRDSTLIARKVASNPRVLCASPEYVAKNGLPRTMSDLKSHQCLRISSLPQWPFLDKGMQTSIGISGRFRSSSVEGVRSLCINGMGIAQLSYWDIREEISQGHLMEIHLEDVSAIQVDIWALLASRKQTPKRVDVFIEALKHSLC